jgi:hypothetical protein
MARPSNASTTSQATEKEDRPSGRALETLAAIIDGPRAIVRDGIPAKTWTDTCRTYFGKVRPSEALALERYESATRRLRDVGRLAPHEIAFRCGVSDRDIKQMTTKDDNGDSDISQN